MKSLTLFCPIQTKKSCHPSVSLNQMFIFICLKYGIQLSHFVWCRKSSILLKLSIGVPPKICSKSVNITQLNSHILITINAKVILKMLGLDMTNFSENNTFPPTEETLLQKFANLSPQEHVSFIHSL